MTATPDDVDEAIRKARTAADVLKALDDLGSAPTAHKLVAAAPAPVAAPPPPEPVRGHEPPLYPTAAMPAGGAFWGRSAEWGKLPADGNLGGGRIDEMVEARKRAEPWPVAGRDMPLEAAIQQAKSPEEVMALLHATQSQTGLEIKGGDAN